MPGSRIIVMWVWLGHITCYENGTNQSNVPTSKTQDNRKYILSKRSSLLIQLISHFNSLSAIHDLCEQLLVFTVPGSLRSIVIGTLSKIPFTCVHIQIVKPLHVRTSDSYTSIASIVIGTHAHLVHETSVRTSVRTSSYIALSYVGTHSMFT